MLLFDMTEEEYEDLRRRAHERELREAVERGEKRGEERERERETALRRGLARELWPRGREAELFDAMDDPTRFDELVAELGIA